jgi:putative transcriptional regulator
MTKSKPRAKPSYRSEIAQSVHKGMSAMHRLGLVDKQTMREFDIRCLTQVDELTAEDIVKMREREGVSQAVFATCLNITSARWSAAPKSRAARRSSCCRW